MSNAHLRRVVSPLCFAATLALSACVTGAIDGSGGNRVPGSTGNGGHDAGVTGSGSDAASIPDTSTTPTNNGDASTPPPPHADAGGPTDTGTTPPPPPPTGALVTGLTISKIDLYQGVQATLAKGGAKATHVAPVVVGREGLLRVSVTPDSGYQPTQLNGVVTISSSSGSKTYTSPNVTISGASDDATLSSTINVDLPAGAITADAQYSVALYAVGTQSGGGSSSGARYPAGGGLEAMSPTATGSVLKIQIVPIKYGADGSNRLPDTSAAQLENYRQAAYEKYPAQQVEITVHAPWSFSGAISADGTGFDEALQALQQQRASENAPADTYWFGAFDGADSFQSFCSGGCVAGLCSVVESGGPGDSQYRACVGIGFTGSDSADTMAHEVGHAHGRQHADCGGATGIDPNYPYSGASIGSWGYSLIDKSLKAPTTYTDMMGYCNPTWISDYNFAALATRMAEVTGGKDVIEWASPRPYRYVTVKADGSLKWGRATTLRMAPSSTQKTVKLFDASGKQTGTATGFYAPFDHLAGGFLLIPEPAGDVASIAMVSTGGDVMLRRPLLLP
jgi:hypothetical protein